MSPEITKDESKADVALLLEGGREMIDYNRCNDCFPRPGNAWAE